MSLDLTRPPDLAVHPLWGFAGAEHTTQLLTAKALSQPASSAGVLLYSCCCRHCCPPCTCADR
eukprot:401107-Prorocentrum_lima.AAC.1